MQKEKKNFAICIFIMLSFSLLVRDAHARHTLLGGRTFGSINYLYTDVTLYPSEGDIYRSTTFSQTYDINYRSIIWRPWFGNYTLGFTYGKADSSSRGDKNDIYKFNYRTNVGLFHLSRFPLRLFANRNTSESFRNGVFHSDSATNKYGSVLNFRPRSWPGTKIRFSLGRNESETSDLTTETERIVNKAEVSLKGKYKGVRTEARYRFSLGDETRTTVSGTAGGDFTSHTATLRFARSFKRYKLDWNSNTAFSNLTRSEGAISSEIFTHSTVLGWRPIKRLSNTVSFSYTSLDTAETTRYFLSFTDEVDLRITSRLTSDGRFSYSLISTPDKDVDTTVAGAGLEYSRRFLRYFSMNAKAGLTYRRVKETPGETTSDVTPDWGLGLSGAAERGRILSTKYITVAPSIFIGQTVQVRTGARHRVWGGRAQVGFPFLKRSMTLGRATVTTDLTGDISYKETVTKSPFVNVKEREFLASLGGETGAIVSYRKTFRPVFGFVTSLAARYNLSYTKSRRIENSIVTDSAGLLHDFTAGAVQRRVTRLYGRFIFLRTTIEQAYRVRVRQEWRSRYLFSVRVDNTIPINIGFLTLSITDRWIYTEGRINKISIGGEGDIVHVIQVNLTRRF